MSEKKSWKDVLQYVPLAPFREKTSNSGIWCRHEDKELEFYVEGISKLNEDNVNRQEYIGKIVEQAKKNNPDEKDIRNKLYPIGMDHFVKLFPKASEYSAWDINICIESPITDNKLVQVGKVPLSLAPYLHVTPARITDAKIYKCGEKFHNKFYTLKIVLAYDGKKLDSMAPGERMRRNRFTSLGVDEKEEVPVVNTIWNI